MTNTEFDLDLSKYKLGWSDEEDYVFKPRRGLNEELVKEMTEADVKLLEAGDETS